MRCSLHFCFMKLITSVLTLILAISATTQRFSWLGGRDGLRLITESLNDPWLAAGGLQLKTVFENGDWSGIEEVYTQRQGLLKDYQANDSKFQYDLDCSNHNIQSTCWLRLELATVLLRPRIKAIASFALNSTSPKLYQKSINNNDSEGQNALDIMFVIRADEDLQRSAHTWVQKHAPFNTTEDEALRMTRYIERVTVEQIRRCEDISKNMNQVIDDSWNVYGQLRIGIGETSVEVQPPSGRWTVAWIHLSVQYLDVTDKDDFANIFPAKNSVDRFKLEHVFEHLSIEEAIVAAKNCFEYLKPGGRMRIAVPEYNHLIHTKSSSSSIFQHLANDDSCSNSGEPFQLLSEELQELQHFWQLMLETGTIAKDIQQGHRTQYSMSSLSALLRSVGFEVIPLEWFSRTGNFCAISFDIDDGDILRSHSRDRSCYSIILDAVKPFTSMRTNGSERELKIQNTDIAVGTSYKNVQLVPSLAFPALPNQLPNVPQNAVGTLSASFDVSKSASADVALNLTGHTVILLLDIEIPVWGRNGAQSKDRQSRILTRKFNGLDNMWYWVVPLLAREVRSMGGDLLVVHTAGAADFSIDVGDAADVSNLHGDKSIGGSDNMRRIFSPDSLFSVKFPVPVMTWPCFLETLQKSIATLNRTANRSCYVDDPKNSSIRTRGLDQMWQGAVLITADCFTLSQKAIIDVISGITVLPLIFPDLLYGLPACVQLAHRNPSRRRNVACMTMNISEHSNASRKCSAASAVENETAKAIAAVATSLELVKAAEKEFHGLLEHSANGTNMTHMFSACTARLGFNIGEMYMATSDDIHSFRQYLVRYFRKDKVEMAYFPFVVLSGVYMEDGDDDAAFQAIISVLAEHKATAPMGCSEEVWILVLGGPAISEAQELSLAIAGLTWIQIFEPVMIAVRRLAYSSALAYLHLPVDTAPRIGAVEVINALACGCPVITSDFKVLTGTFDNEYIRITNTVHFINVHSATQLWLVIRQLVHDGFGGSTIHASEGIKHPYFSTGITLVREETAYNTRKYFLGWYPLVECVMNAMQSMLA